MVSSNTEQLVPEVRYGTGDPLLPSAFGALSPVWVERITFLQGSDNGDERAAAFYSLIGTAKLNGIDPKLYLRQLVEHIGDHPINRISLLPWNLIGDVNQRKRPADTV